MTPGELWFRVCGYGVERPTAQVRRDAMCFPPDWSGCLCFPLYLTWESNIHYPGSALLCLCSQASGSTRAFLWEDLSLCLENSTAALN